MKLAKDVLLEIVDIVRQGLVTNTDISDRLRGLDLEVSSGEAGLAELKLTEEYLLKNPRGSEWEDSGTEDGGAH